MAKLVVLSAALGGQSYELKVDRTTVGRVEDNTFQIPQASVSSHHCEVWLRGNDVVIKDLNSTNGTFINNQQITGEAVLKPGQTLRLGEIELRLDAGDGPGPGPVSSEPGQVASQSKRQAQTGSTMVINRGVTIDQLGKESGSIETTKGVFTKKTNKTNRIFIIIAIVLLIVIIVAIYMVMSSLNAPKPGGIGH